MAELSVLRHDEGVRIDSDRLMALYDDLGAAGAEAVICRAMDELSHRMQDMRDQVASQDFAGFSRHARCLGRVAGQVGMTLLARVAFDVADCGAGGDRVALSATWARLSRIGDRSLVAVWDMQDMSV